MIQMCIFFCMKKRNGLTKLPEISTSTSCCISTSLPVHNLFLFILVICADRKKKQIKSIDTESLNVCEIVQAAWKLPPLGRDSGGCGGSGAWSVSPHAPVPPREDGSRRWDPEERGWPPPEEVTQTLVTCSSHPESPNPWNRKNASLWQAF